MDEVHDNFEKHFDEDEKVWFLEELIDKLQYELDYYKMFNGEEYE